MDRLSRGAKKKKEVEAFYFERFRSLLPAFPSGEIEPFEEPDFLVCRKDSVLGIEITELHRLAPPGASSQQARQAMRQQVIQRAHEIYLSENRPVVRVRLFMNELAHIKSSEVERLAKQICDLAIRNLPGPSMSGEECCERTNRDYFPQLVESIKVHRIDGMHKTHFICPGSTWVGILSQVDVVLTLLAKDKKYFAYRKNCKEAWLVIVLEIQAMSTWFQLDPALLQHSFTSCFDRVFILRQFDSELHELKVQRPGKP